jgi:outer membrane protein insertion porin family
METLHLTRNRNTAAMGRQTDPPTHRSRAIKIIILILALFLSAYAYGNELQAFRVDKINFTFNGRPDEKKARKYKLLLNFKTGDTFSYKNIRKSMEHLYKIGSIGNIEVSIEKMPESKVNVVFAISGKYTIRSIFLSKNKSVKKSSLINSLYSFRVGSYFNPDDIKKTITETRNFLESRGYFNSRIDSVLSKDKETMTASLVLFIKTGKQTRINKVIFILPNKKLLTRIRGYFTGKKYLPYKFKDKIESIKNILKKQKYYFPEVEIKPQFLEKTKLSIDLEVNVKPGFKYIFHFLGMKKNIGLISSIWEKKRFEKWAEKESTARILYFLKNKGYLDAEIESNIKIKGVEKHLTFTVKKNRQYRLGKVSFSGNEAISSKRLGKAITTDDKIFDVLFWLRASSLYIDLGVLEQVYHFNGYPQAQIAMQLDRKGRKTDIDFKIDEGKRLTIESILFDGNIFFDRAKLLSFLRTKESGPFVPQVLNGDVETLLAQYHVHGFDEVEIIPEISPGREKSVLFKITEGDAYKMGNLIIVGASSSQEKLLKKLFPLKINSDFNRDKIERFNQEIETSGIFNEVKIRHIKKGLGFVDILVKVVPDESKYYSFGVGWESRKDVGLRGTLEYQGRNIFNSTSSLSAMVQLGFQERRGLLSYDTPYFFKNKVNSSFKIWIDSEIFPTYSFNRYGFGESLVRKMSPNSYILASLSWYRTELTDLSVSEFGVDKLFVPFDTTAINFSYVLENRDDPFNPSTGDYFSSDIKVGFPLFEKSYSFIKFLWSYQRNFKFLKYGTLAMSVRNGFASGEMSITERFFAGGVHSFRGTKNDYLSPVDVVTGNPKGGNALVLFNFEATFPILIIPVNDFYYSLFFDIGNVFEKVNDFDMSRLERAAGFSLKIKTQMGPIRVDFGWSLHKRPEGNFVWNIGIGNVF